MSYEEEDERIEREAKDFAKQKAIHAEITALESRCARQAELLERVMSLLPGFEIGTVFPESVWTQHPEISYRDIQREKDLIKEAKILLADYGAFRKENE